MVAWQSLAVTAVVRMAQRGGQKSDGPTDRAGQLLNSLYLLNSLNSQFRRTITRPFSRGPGKIRTDIQRSGNQELSGQLSCDGIFVCIERQPAWAVP